MEEALDLLPDWIVKRLDNVSVLIEPTPPPEQPNLAGLYDGVPLTRRDSGYQMVLPDRITLFRSVLRNGAHTEGDVRERVRHTVLHEVAHFFRHLGRSVARDGALLRATVVNGG